MISQPGHFDKLDQKKTRGWQVTATPRLVIADYTNQPTPLRLQNLGSRQIGANIVTCSP